MFVFLEMSAIFMEISGSCYKCISVVSGKYRFTGKNSETAEIESQRLIAEIAEIGDKRPISFPFP